MDYKEKCIKYEMKISKLENEIAMIGGKKT